MCTRFRTVSFIYEPIRLVLGIVLKSGCGDLNKLNFTKGHLSEVVLYQGGGLKDLAGVLLGKECPDSKNSGVLKTAKSGNFETANYIVIGRFLTILWQFSQQKRSF